MAKRHSQGACIRRRRRGLRGGLRSVAGCLIHGAVLRTSVLTCTNSPYTVWEQMTPRTSMGSCRGYITKVAKGPTRLFQPAMTSLAYPELWGRYTMSSIKILENIVFCSMHPTYLALELDIHDKTLNPTNYAIPLFIP